MFVILLLLYIAVSALVTAVGATPVGATPVGVGPAEQPAQTAQPGWYADPTGRSQRRYFDGHAWTDHV